MHWTRARATTLHCNLLMYAVAKHRVLATCSTKFGDCQRKGCHAGYRRGSLALHSPIHCLASRMLLRATRSDPAGCFMLLVCTSVSNFTSVSRPPGVNDTITYTQPKGEWNAGRSISCGFTHPALAVCRLDLEVKESVSVRVCEGVTETIERRNCMQMRAHKSRRCSLHDFRQPRPTQPTTQLSSLNSSSIVGGKADTSTGYWRNSTSMSDLGECKRHSS